MRVRIGVAVAALLLLIAGGFLVTFLGKRRAEAGDIYCKNNFRELSMFALAARADMPAQAPVFASEKGEGKPKAPLTKEDIERLRQLGLPTAIPAGTVVNPALPPEQRLSWVVEILPGMNQRRQDTIALAGSIDKSQAWDAPPNLAPARKGVLALICPGNPIEVPAGSPGLTQYVGSGGVGPDGPTAPATSPVAGCFRYDAPTPLPAIGDGLSQSILYCEVSTHLGPWLQGGPSTIRTFDPSSPTIGPGMRFGGNHPAGANFGMADGSARFLTPRTAPAVLAGLFTINGGPVIGE